MSYRLRGNRTEEKPVITRCTIYLVALLLLSIVAFASAAEAQQYEFGVYDQVIVTKDAEPAHRIFVDGYKYFGEKWGMWGFAYGEKQYGSGVLGLFREVASFGPDTVIEIGLAAGAETFPEESSEEYKLYPRLAGTLFVGNSVLFTDVYYENGTSREGWLRVNALWQATEHFAVGGIHQTGDGTGPRAILSVPKTPLRLWAAPMFGERKKLLLGAELVF